MNENLPLNNNILESKAGYLLSYPKYYQKEAKRRLNELRKTGVEALLFRGPHIVEGLKILGKGHVGVVVAAKMKESLIAVKIRRVDADRDSLKSEAANLEKANSVNVGPALLSATDNILLMELVEGDYFIKWIEKLTTSEENTMKQALKQIFEKSRSLDRIGLDHGELSNADRHIIMAGATPRIIDFESASTRRRCRNTTSLAHYLLFNERVRNTIERIMKLPKRSVIIDSLKRYKDDPTEETFRTLLEALNLFAQRF